MNLQEAIEEALNFNGINPKEVKNVETNVGSVFFEYGEETYFIMIDKSIGG